MKGLTRRRLLAGGLPFLGAGAAALHSRIPHSHPWEAPALAADRARGHPAHGGGGPAIGGHADFRAGATVDHRANGFDPAEILRDFDWGRTRRLASGRVL